MSDKGDLARLNKELGEAYDRILAIVDKYPSIMVYTDKDWSESSSAICEHFSLKMDYFRKQLRKINDQLPSPRKKPIKWKG